MEKKELSLSGRLIYVNFNVITSNIKLYRDNVISPLLRYSGDFDIQDDFRQVIITEKSKQPAFQLGGLKIGGLTLDNISFYDNAKLTINGRDYQINASANASEKDNTSREVELIVPTFSSNLSVDIASRSGNLTIEDLVLLRLVAKMESGNITLNDVDFAISKLKTERGNITAKIAESITNYETFLNGSTNCKSTETMPPTVLSNKHRLEAEASSGTIDIEFKGKNR